MKGDYIRDAIWLKLNRQALQTIPLSPQQKQLLAQIRAHEKQLDAKSRQKNPGPARHTIKFDRCVHSVKKRLKGVTNPYAVCMAALGKRASRKKRR